MGVICSKNQQATVQLSKNTRCETKPVIGFAPRHQYNATKEPSSDGLSKIAYGNKVRACQQRYLFYIRNLRNEHMNFPQISQENIEKLKESVKNPSKTAISMLQEFSNCHAVRPLYELVQVIGEHHAAMFRYRVYFNDIHFPYVAVGELASSKKEAKHSAARAVIAVITNTQMTACTDAEKKPGSDSDEENELSTPECKSLLRKLSMPVPDLNPIGKLQELCMARHWAPPVYNMTLHTRSPNERLYVIEVKLLDKQTSGRGKTKKIAKREAAEKMLNLLKQESDTNKSPITAKIPHRTKSPETAPQRCPSTKKQQSCVRVKERQCSDRKTSKLQFRSASKIRETHVTQQFRRELSLTAGMRLNRLCFTSLSQPGVKYECMLSEIAAENEFPVRYEYIEPSTSGAPITCLVQIKDPPIITCYGSDITLKEAQRQAARTALLFLKLLIKK